MSGQRRLVPGDAFLRIRLARLRQQGNPAFAAERLAGLYLATVERVEYRDSQASLMRTLIFGAQGQLGRDLRVRLAQAGEVLGVDLPEVDIAAADAARATLDRFPADCVINAAGYTDVEGAEADAEAAFRVNQQAAGLVARAAASANVPVIYYSTDYVFDGTKGRPYEPEDPAAPMGVYARSKWGGEVATREANPRHFIIRTAWLYGPGGHNFVEKILHAATTRPSVKVVDDEIGSPTYTWDLAGATAALCKTGDYGTYHIVNAGSCSRWEFARAIVRLARIDATIAPCRSSEFPTKVVRPLYSVLSNTKFEAATGHAMRDWKEALRAYMDRRRHNA
jgi:dTDP-4-dehydrorhamnose reductase